MVGKAGPWIYLASVRGTTSDDRCWVGGVFVSVCSVRSECVSGRVWALGLVGGPRLSGDRGTSTNLVVQTRTRMDWVESLAARWGRECTSSRNSRKRLACDLGRANEAVKHQSRSDVKFSSRPGETVEDARRTACCYFAVGRPAGRIRPAFGQCRKVLAGVQR